MISVVIPALIMRKRHLPGTRVMNVMSGPGRTAGRDPVWTMIVVDDGSQDRHRRGDPG